MEIGGHVAVVLEGGVGVFPDAEEVDLAAGLLALLAVVVRGKGKNDKVPRACVAVIVTAIGDLRSSVRGFIC
jgi:hypothetical protein